MSGAEHQRISEARSVPRGMVLVMASDNTRLQRIEQAARDVVNLFRNFKGVASAEQEKADRILREALK